MELLYDNSHFDELIAKGYYEELSKIRVKIEEDCLEYDPCARRPFYKLRGKSVTEEQAVEIIARTDEVFEFDLRKQRDSEKFISMTHIRNFWLVKDFFPPSHGWIHPSGLVGGNGITDKYPTFGQLMADVVDLKLAFPHLEFILAVSEWDEIPPEAWEDPNRHKKPEEDYQGFEEVIEIVFHSHDDVIEAFTKTKGTKAWKKWKPVYEQGIRNTRIYTSEYYYDKKENPVSREFLEKCMRVHGLTVEDHDNLEGMCWIPQKQ